MNIFSQTLCAFDDKLLLCVAAVLCLGMTGATAYADNKASHEASLKAFKDRLAASEPMRETQQEVKEFFPWGVFYFGVRIDNGRMTNDISTDAKVRADLMDIKAHGCNTIQVFGAGKIERRKRLLEIAEEVGLKVMLFEDRVFALIHKHKGPGHISAEDAKPMVTDSVEALSSYDSLLGYYVYDEPTISNSRSVGNATRVFEELDPHHAAITNHNLSGAHRGPLLGRQDRVGGLVFQYGNYQPLISKNNQDPVKAAMSVGLEEAHAVAAAYDIPLWTVISAKNEKGLDRQALSIRARVYLSLAYGAKGIIYYLYPTVGDTSNGGRVQNGLVDVHGEPTPAWAEYAKLSEDMKVLAPLALKLTKRENMAVAAEPIDAQTLTHEDGSTYLIMANLNLDSKTQADVQLKSGAFSEAVDVISGKVHAVQDGKLTMSMSPGDGRCFKLK